MGDTEKWSRHNYEKVDIGEMQDFLEIISYPVSKEDLIRHARDQGEDDSLVATLAKLPNRVFENAKDAAGSISFTY